MNTIEYTNRGVCSVCGKPADGAINVASHWQSPMKMESRCEEHGAFVGSFIPRARLAELEAAEAEVARLRALVDDEEDIPPSVGTPASSHRSVGRKASSRASPPLVIEGLEGKVTDREARLITEALALVDYWDTNGYAIDACDPVYELVDTCRALLAERAAAIPKPRPDFSAIGTQVIEEKRALLDRLASEEATWRV